MWNTDQFASDGGPDAQDWFAGWQVTVNPIDNPRPTGAPLVGYVRWIPEHSDVLISRVIAACPHLDFVDLQLFSGQSDPTSRRAITQAAEREPVRFRRLVLARLTSLKQAGLKLVIFTLDWTAPLREIVFACRSLGIATVLIPHESVFSTQDTYYTQKRRKTNAPLVDHVLCWGELQKKIFAERGYPSQRLTKVGSPKLDFDVRYRPILTTEQFKSLFGIPEAAKILVFAMQPMDNYADKVEARQRQAAAVSDVLRYSTERGHHLIVRTPPAREQILPDFVWNRLSKARNVSVDIAGQYILTPEETIAHADIVCSVNSTMLFEARLMEVPSIAMKYIDLPSIWENTDIAIARSGLEFSMKADRLLESGRQPMSKTCLSWASREFSDAEFGIDGKSLERIKGALDSILSVHQAPMRLGIRVNDPSTDIFYPSSVTASDDLVATYGKDKLASLLGVSAVFEMSSPYEAASGDVFVASTTSLDPAFDRYGVELGRPLLRFDPDRSR
ncbi:hypothetical protein [Ciceribacter sp. L1K22]|uniref:hypothetical protein n=1 Tax=Ciceribacter sp. L1K22 TaxID=2820275 RepID=UPI001ABE9195|nr:hypothetical protein [Ciceribacter sp. L1K22]MBO3758408.1 hypothetical protein [Ciceribacter sp. L1K22]